MTPACDNAAAVCCRRRVTATSRAPWASAAREHTSAPSVRRGADLKQRGVPFEFGIHKQQTGAQPPRPSPSVGASDRPRSSCLAPPAPHITAVLPVSRQQHLHPPSPETLQLKVAGWLVCRCSGAAQLQRPPSPPRRRHCHQPDGSRHGRPTAAQLVMVRHLPSLCLSRGFRLSRHLLASLLSCDLIALLLSVLGPLLLYTSPVPHTTTASARDRPP